jgi:hypothetical protein
MTAFHILTYSPLIIIYPTVLMMYNICSWYSIVNPFHATHNISCLEGLDFLVCVLCGVWEHQ